MSNGNKDTLKQEVMSGVILAMLTILSIRQSIPIVDSIPLELFKDYNITYMQLLTVIAFVFYVSSSMCFYLMWKAFTNRLY